MTKNILTVASQSVYIHIVPAFLLQAMWAEVLLNTQMWQQFKLYDKAKLKIQLKCIIDVSAWPASSKSNCFHVFITSLNSSISCLIPEII